MSLSLVLRSVSAIWVLLHHLTWRCSNIIIVSVTGQSVEGHGVGRLDNNDNAKGAQDDAKKPVENEDLQNGTGKLKVAHKGSLGNKNETECSLIMFCNYITFHDTWWTDRSYKVSAYPFKWLIDQKHLLQWHLRNRSLVHGLLTNITWFAETGYITLNTWPIKCTLNLVSRFLNTQRGFYRTWLLAFTKSCASHVSRVVGLFRPREKPLQRGKEI